MRLGTFSRLRYTDTLIPAVLVLFLFIGGCSQLSNYSVTWDEALGDLFFGERYFSYFTSFDSRYLKFDAEVYPADRIPDLSSSMFRGVPWEYYPVANTLAGGTADILARRLGLLDPFDGFHAANLILGGLLIITVYGFMLRRFGRLPGILAVGLILSSPRITGDLFANIKDFPEMVFFAMAAMAFHGALMGGSRRGLLAAGALWGLALGTKANAIFLPAIPLLTVVLGRVPPPWRQRRRALGFTFAAAALIGFAVLFLSWPWLWADPIGRYGRHLRYLAERGFATAPPGTHAAPLAMICYTLPIPFLISFAIGLVPTVRAGFARNPDALFLLTWISVVLARTYMPGAVNYDGVRHFLEIFPPMAMVAAMGVRWVTGLILEHSWRAAAAARAVTLIMWVLPLVGTTAALAAAHPFELAYWNGLVGGLHGARTRGIPQAGDYYGASYRIGLRWLNEHAPAGSLLAVPIAEHIVRLTASVWMRPDIELANLTSAGLNQEQQVAMLHRTASNRPVFVMFIRRDDWMGRVARECVLRLRPERSWLLDGEPVLEIYRLPRTNPMMPSG